MQINKLLTPYNFTDANNAGRVRYIVIHYVGALGGAKANCQYYARQYIGASAHYFVGFEGEIWQSVADEDVAWHCGASSYKHGECRNSNSIGIELCVRFLYKGIIIKHNKTEPTYTKTSLFLCEKRRFFMARTEKGGKVF